MCKDDPGTNVSRVALSFTLSGLKKGLMALHRAISAAPVGMIHITYRILYGYVWINMYIQYRYHYLIFHGRVKHLGSDPCSALGTGCGDKMCVCALNGWHLCFVWYVYDETAEWTETWACWVWFLVWTGFEFCQACKPKKAKKGWKKICKTYDIQMWVLQKQCLKVKPMMIHVNRAGSQLYKKM